MQGPGLNHICPHPMNIDIMPFRATERAERGYRERERERWTDVITKIFRRRTELRLENNE